MDSSYTFACKNYQVRRKKKIHIIFLACTGSDVDKMKYHVQVHIKTK